MVHLSDLPADALLGRRRDAALDRVLQLAASASRGSKSKNALSWPV
jgi:hypothetical protein